ncbi:MAG: hypothetical protein Q9171_005590 [Xanthocarpia ochracea]
MSTTNSPEVAPSNPVKAGDKFPDGVKFSYVICNGEESLGSQLLADLTLPVKAMFRILPRRRQLPHAEYLKRAFTPGCSARHLPGFIDHLSEIKSKGVDLVVVIAFNDAWVMSAWSKANNIKDEIIRIPITGALTMFRFHKSLDVITLFHKASSPASVRAQTLLKQISAHASETATEDQATDHSEQNKFQRTEFELNITEDPPTSDQLRTILEYVGSGGGRASQIVEGATGEADALKKLKENPNSFQRPVVRFQHPITPYRARRVTDMVEDCGLEQRKSR